MPEHTKEPFQREERYIVVKRKHMSAVQETALRAHLARLAIGTVECAVIESDWPEYETVWQMVEARVSGTGALAGIADPAAYVAAARGCVEALESLIAACDRGRMVLKPGAGVCGMSIDAQTRASCINGVDAWPVEEAREAYDAFRAATGDTE